MNTCEMSRTNAFRVKDLEKFKDWVALLQAPGDVDVTDEGDGLVALLMPDGCPQARSLWPEEAMAKMREEGFPEEDISDPDEVEDYALHMGNVLEGEKFDFIRELSAHLVEGEVAVGAYCGWEGMRAVWGGAWAVDCHGKVISVSSTDILDMCEKAFGIRPNPPRSE
jgi:hypothetical protein